jgi:uncharacterized protein (DUF1697 family)
MKEQNQIPYIILLRAVNVSGKNIIKMAALRQKLQDAGFSNATTYIQSGNILLRSAAPAELIQRQVKALIQDQFGLTVETFVLDMPLLKKALSVNPLQGELAPNRLFITMLDKTPEKALIETLKATDHGNETFDVVDNILYFYLPDGAARAKMSNNYFEKKLQVIATGRNLNTYQKLLELAENL